MTGQFLQSLLIKVDVVDISTVVPTNVLTLQNIVWFFFSIVLFS